MLGLTKTTVNSATPPSSSRANRLILRVLLILTGVLILIALPVFIPLAMFLPVLIVMAGDSNPLHSLLPLVMIAAVGWVLFGVFSWFASRKKYITGVLLLDLFLIFLIFFVFDEKIKDLAEAVGAKAGFHLADDVPPGMLNINPNTIPQGYFSSHKGENLSTIYLKEYHNSPYPLWFPGGDKGNIELIYSLEPLVCQQFHSEDFQPATCKLGACVVRRQVPRPAVTTITQHFDGSVTSKTAEPKFTSKDTTFVLNDNGRCATLSFHETDEAKLLTEEEIMRVVDSLERAPGNTPFSFEEYSITSLERVRNNLERSMRTREKSYGLSRVYPGIKEGDCKSDIFVDIAPKGDAYVVHQPICPDMKMSYCVQSNQKEIIKAPTELIQKTYRCK